jgi:phosphoribosylamine--glycine ligase
VGEPTLTRVLLVGSGAREHAIATALAKSPNADLYVAMSNSNPGIMKLAKEATILQINDTQGVVDYAKRAHVELAVVGPEAPLVNGVTDSLAELGIECVGPTRKLASLEGDKSFCRNLLSKYGIAGNPLFRVFTEPDSAEAFLRTAGPVAIKPAGLTGGKGVKITGEDLPTKQDEIAYAKEILQNRIGGSQRLVVEERLNGEEFSLQAFVDGHDVYPMPLVQDHKRAYENDCGPNTGGMGSYSDRDHLLPFVSREDFEISSRMMTDVIRALEEETGENYRGLLYGQFMLARSMDEEKPSPKLIEFNCRFGDPEAMNVLPILSEETDFMEVCERIAEGSLKSKYFSFLPKATVCKYLVPATYPDPAAPQTLRINEEALGGNACLFYASVEAKNGQITTTASRTVAVLGIAETLREAEQIAEHATDNVEGPLRHRRDIGTEELIQKRIEHMKSLGANIPTINPEMGIA